MKTSDKRPTCLMSPPPYCWHPGGGGTGNDNAARASLRGGTNPKEAGLEWLAAANDISRTWRIIVMPPGKRPQRSFDKVFAADIGRYFKGTGFLVSNMRAPDRMGESAYVKWFFSKKLRMKMIGQARSFWEGSSCVRTSPKRTFAVVGYGVRADRGSCDEISRLLKFPPDRILRIQLKKPHIHLDTGLARLSSCDPLIVVCRAAFADADETWDPDETFTRLYELTREEGSAFENVCQSDGVNYATNLREEPNGQVYVPNGLTAFYAKVLGKYGYKVHPLNMPRLFEDGGGAAACLTLPLQEAVEDGWEPPEQYLYENVRAKIQGQVELYPTHQV